VLAHWLVGSGWDADIGLASALGGRHDDVTDVIVSKSRPSPACQRSNNHYRPTDLITDPTIRP